MKKLAKLLLVVSAVICFAFAFAACGGSGDKYTYSETKLEVDLGSAELPAEAVAQIKQQYAVLETTFDTMFKDSELEVTDSKLIWSLKDQKNELSVEKDGDKDVLAGDMMDLLVSALGSMVGANASYSMYGQKTDGGYSIIYTVNMSASGINMEIKMSYNFKKA